MSKINYKIFLILIAFIFSVNFCLAAADNPKEAIAIRVMPNTDHISPLLWYKQNVQQAGSPQSLIVDGYQAVRDGRTVYVSAANIDNNNIYTNIYIISFNQEAEAATTDIFAQILKYWKFNIELTDDLSRGVCLPSDGKVCKSDDDCDVAGTQCSNGVCAKPCYLDSVCGDNSYCDSQKAKVRRDVLRLAQLTDVQNQLLVYFQTRNNFPQLPDGSYIVGRSISVWPSWKETLGKEINMNLPIDPINKLGACASNFDKITCWDESNKRFATDFNNPVLPVGSFAYVYFYDFSLGKYKLCANFETAYANWPTEFRCDSYFLPPISNKVEVLLGGLMSAEGQVSAYANVSSLYPINWEKTIITPVNPNNWQAWESAGWTFYSGYDGLKLVKSASPSWRALSASQVKLPAGQHLGKFDFSIKVFDLYGNYGQANGTMTICQPKDCGGVECGQLNDNCGGTLLCGDCSARTDGRNRCVNYQCVN